MCAEMSPKITIAQSLVSMKALLSYLLFKARSVSSTEILHRSWPAEMFSVAADLTFLLSFLLSFQFVVAMLIAYRYFEHRCRGALKMVGPIF